MDNELDDEILTDVVEDDLETLDSLGVYMKELSKFPVLKKDEEFELSKQIQEAKLNILKLAIKSKDCLSNLFLLNELQVTELKALFRRELELENSQSVSEILARMNLLITNFVEKSEKKPFRDFLETLDFSEQLVMRIAEPIKNSKGCQKIISELRQSKTKMAESNLKLVFFVARKYLNRGIPLEDLIQEGNKGLLKAIDRYDYRRGLRFSTYATWWISQHCGRAVADKGRTIRIPVYLVEKINKITRATNDLTQELGKDPTLRQVAARAEVSIADVKKAKRLKKPTTYLEDPVVYGGDTFSEFLVDEDTPSPYEVLERKEVSMKVRSILSQLSEREEKVLRLRFGIGESRPKTLREIGNILKCSRQRIQQIEIKGLAKVRKRAEGIKNATVKII